MPDVTKILDAIQSGDCRARDELFPIVYEELRNLAAAKLAREAPGHTLQATALVHEAYLRLVGPRGAAGAPGWESRRHFFGAAAEAMRRVLIDHARRRGAARRGGPNRSIEEVQNVLELAAVDDPAEVLALDEALGRLEREDTDAASVVRLRFFAGLSGEEVAGVLGVSARQVDREWSYARAFLLRALREPDGVG